MENYQKLEDMPNIGRTLAQLLRETEINTPGELYQTGSLQAFIRIIAIDPDACFSKLCALEGAIEGIRWHKLPGGKKDELLHFFATISK